MSFHGERQRGKHVTGIDFPLGFTPFEIGADYLLGVHIDGDGVEPVREYRLVRQPQA